MTELKINIPTRSLDNFGAPMNFIFESISKINTSKVNTIHFDFNNCKFISPFIIGGLVSIIQNQTEIRKRVVYSFNNQNEDLSNYLKTICFPEGFNYGNYPLNILDKALEIYHSKNYIPIVCFPATQTENDGKVREKIISAINSIFKNQLKLSGQVPLLRRICP